MQCGFVIKSNRSERTLLLARQEQKNLSQWLAEIIADHLFVFNTTEGVYLFLAEEHCTALLEKQLDTYLQKNVVHENEANRSRNSFVGGGGEDENKRQRTGDNNLAFINELDDDDENKAFL